MQNNVVIVLMKIYHSNLRDKIASNIICIILWGAMCTVYTMEDIMPNPKFKSSGLLLVLLIVSRKVNFVDTR